MVGSVLALAVAVAGWQGAAVAASPAASGAPLSPAAVLARSKEAMGGSAWDGVRSSHSRVRIETGGLKGTDEGFNDLLKGRHYETFKLGPLTGAEGWDGQSGWTQDNSGQTKQMEGDNEVEGAVNEAYRRCLAYWYPDRWPATVEDGGTHEVGGRRFQVVKITPKGGRLFEIWIDAGTWLVDRIVERQAIETRTTYFSDYRAVDGKKIAFAWRSTNGETKYDQIFAVDSIEFDVPLDESKFRMPAAPPPDFAFAEGKTATTVPFELINNHIYVKVKLNGQGPFTFLCDTGGANVITPTLAARLGVKPEGALEGRGVGEKSEDVGLVTLESLAVGDVTLRKQLFAVFALEGFADVEGVPQAGLIGYEVFKRFVVRVDYENDQLTLTVPSSFAYQGHGTVVPFRFNEQIPQVEGSIDGVPGKFDIDTGSRASLSLLRPFAEKNDLKKKLGARYEAVTGWGVGGASRGLIARARELRLGDVSIPSPVTELSQQQKGSFIDPYVAGNVGAGVLKRFNIVFDYAGKRLIFEPNANNALPDVYDRSGMWINRAGAALNVVDVTGGGPAEAAGLRAGDAIVAVDGAPVDDATLVALRKRFRADPPGTKIRLSVNSGDKKRDVTLVLKDLI
ncbi:MAG: aspartyl protease family protein [Acidithiobacillales bacterium]